MSVYMTEEEQLEAIKKWWQRYSTPIFIVLSIIMLSIAAYRYYNWHHDKILTNASVTYERMMVSFANQNNTDVKAFANDLIKNYPGYVYSDVAKLLLVKQKVANKRSAQAEQYLADLAKQSKIPALRQIAKIRLARLQLAAKQYEKSLLTLSVSDDAAFEPIVAELKGDVYVLMGERQKALAAYQKAIDLTASLELPNLFLEMKANAIQGPTEGST